jgi:hypothetical protein
MASRLTTMRRRPGIGRPRPNRVLRLLAVATVIAGAAALNATAATAAPTGNSNSDAKYYVSRVTAIEPATPGLEVVVHGAGESVTLTNGTGKTVTVVGYSGEDYLRITSSGVQQNSNSMTAALNKTQGKGPLPEKFSSNASKDLPVVWQKVNDTNTFTWNDFRTRWGVDQRPPIVQEHPHSRHQVFAWAIQLKIGKTPALVRGDVTWIGTPVPPRSNLAPIAFAGILVVALLVLLVGLRLRRRRRRLARSRTLTRTQPGPRAGPRASDSIDDRSDDRADGRAVDSTGAR